MIKNKIIINGHSIKIIEQKERHNVSCADTNLWKNQIYLTENVTETMKEQYLCHEIVHHFFQKSGATTYLQQLDCAEKNKIEEQLCASIEMIFWRFLKDNTDFFEEKK